MQGRGERSARRVLAVTVLAITACLTAACGSGSSNASCDLRLVSVPALAPEQAARARASALADPQVRGLLAGRAPVSVTVSSLGVRHTGKLVGARVRIVLPPGTQGGIRGVWPWLLVDQTGTTRPPYVVVRRELRASGVSVVDLAVLAPGYHRAVPFGLSAARIVRAALAPGSADTRPPQPPRCS